MNQAVNGNVGPPRWKRPALIVSAVLALLERQRSLEKDLAQAKPDDPANRRCCRWCSAWSRGICWGRPGSRLMRAMAASSR
jgi:hypothetical protein